MYVLNFNDRFFFNNIILSDDCNKYYVPWYFQRIFFFLRTTLEISVHERALMCYP